MKNVLYAFSLILLAFMFNSCFFNAVRGNRTIVEKEFKIEDYKSIDFNGGCTLVYEQKKDSPAYLRIETDENILNHIVVDSKNGTLSIDKEKGVNLMPSKFVVYTNSTTIEKINASGSIKAELKGKVETNNLEFDVSGSGSLVANDLIAQSIRTSISGSGDISLKGSTASLNCRISGSGKVLSSEMIAQDVDCKVSGSGTFLVNAQNNLKVDISGSGTVRYKGSPKIEQSISGSGKVINDNE